MKKAYLKPSGSTTISFLITYTWANVYIRKVMLSSLEAKKLLKWCRVFLQYGRFDVLTVVKTPMLSYCVVVPCTPVDRYQILEKYTVSIFRSEENYICPKHWCLPTSLHGMTTQTNISIFLCQFTIFRMINKFFAVRNPDGPSLSSNACNWYQS